MSATKAYGWAWLITVAAGFIVAATTFLSDIIAEGKYHAVVTSTVIEIAAVVFGLAWYAASQLLMKEMDKSFGGLMTRNVKAVSSHLVSPVDEFASCD